MKAILPLVLGFTAVPVLFTVVGLTLTAYGAGAAMAVLAVAILAAGAR